MTRSQSSLAALSMIAVLAVMLPPRLATSATPNPAHVVRALTGLAHPFKPGMPTIALAVCHDCPASQALVRVTLRQLTAGQSLPPLQLLTDRTWPALDTLARRTQSSLTTIPQLSNRIGVTPAAIDVRETGDTRRTAPAIGLPDCLTLITHAESRQ